MGREDDDEVAAISVNGVPEHLWVGIREDADVGDGKVECVSRGGRFGRGGACSIDPFCCVFGVEDA